MKITDIVCHIVSVPNQRGQISRNWIFVEVQTDEGITGIGEATTEYHELAVKAQIDSELKVRLVGMDPTDIERIWQLGYRDFWWRRGVVHSSAISGIDQALWDIAGKAADKPVFKLLGGKVRERVRCYIRRGPEFAHLSLADAAKASLEMGYDAFKCSTGDKVQPMDLDKQVEIAVAELTQMRQALGPEPALMIDCQGLFTPHTAHKLVKGIRPLNMFFVEEPVNMDTLEPTFRLKRDFPDVPIALGERMNTRWDFRPWFEQQAIDVCQADICHCGGISELMKIAHYAEVYGITIAPHNPYGPVALAAAAHAAAAMPNFLILEHCNLQPHFDKIQKLAVPFDGGRIDLAQLAGRPGLGIELDMDYLRAHSGHQPLASRRMLDADGAAPLN